MTDLKFTLDWRKPLCGGKDINGSADCSVDEDSGEESCKCIVPPKNFNFPLHHILAQAVFVKKMYLTKNETEWDKFALWMFTVGGFKNYKQIQGATLKVRFHTEMVKLVQQKHGLGPFANGFEAHPEKTPYDKNMIKMIEEIAVIEDAKLVKKKKQEEKQNAMLGVEEDVLPYISSKVKTSKIYDDEGDSVGDGDEDSEDEVEDKGKGSRKREKGLPSNHQKQSHRPPPMPKQDTFLMELKTMFPGAQSLEESPATKELQKKHKKLKLQLECAQMEAALSSSTSRSSSGLIRDDNSSITTPKERAPGMFDFLR